MFLTKPTRISIIAALCVFALPLLANAEYKISTVDVNRIINDSAESKTLRKKLDEKTLEAKKKIEAKRDSLKAKEDKLKEKQVAEDSKEAESLRSEIRDFARFVKDNEDDLKKEFLKANKTLTDKAIAQVKAYATKHNIDLVLDKSDGARSPVLFGQAGSDITDALLKEQS